MSKFKITGIGRLFIFLLLFAPIAYIGASFINGENGIDKIKGMFGGTGSSTKIENPINDTELNNRNEEIIKELRRENARLKRKITDLEAQIGQ